MHGCLVPVLDPGYGATDGAEEIPVAKADLIVVTQSSDLVHAEIPLVALCRIVSLSDLAETDPIFLLFLRDFFLFCAHPC